MMHRSLPTDEQRQVAREARERSEQYAREYIAQAREREAEIRVQQARKNSDLGERFDERTFATYSIPPGDERAYREAEAAASECSGLWLYGPVGTGKTHLTAAIVNALNARGISAPFVTSLRLLDRIKAAFGRENENSVIDEYIAAPMLVLDDMDKAKFTEWASQRFYALVNARYEKQLPIIVTTNATPADLGLRWQSQGLDKMLADAALDRLIEMSGRILQIRGESFRAPRPIR